MNSKSVLQIAAAFVLLLGAAAFLTNNSSAAATGAVSTAPTRGYYAAFSATDFDGSHALKACAVGYHMASVFELLEPSSLTYRRGLGFNQSDSGYGPPMGIFGWARTGNGSDNGGSGGPSSEGFSNCKNWTSNSSSDYGTLMILLPSNYPIAQSHYSLGPWVVVADACSLTTFVWCIQS